MIRSLTFHATVASLCCFWATVQNAYAVLLAEPSDTKREMLPMTSAFAPGVTTRRMSRQRPVEWDGEQYACKDAVPVLMSAILDVTAAGAHRLDALGKMTTLSNQITNTAWVDELISRYHAAVDRDEKIGLLQCLIGSEDPRAFPVFVQTLEQETDRTIRLFAAGGLAQWNVRRGTAELFAQLHVDELVPGGSTLANEAMKAIQSFNRTKAWGLPEKEIWSRIEARGDLDKNQKVALYASEVKEWFADNAHRFPDWKPGDPLPKVSVPDKDESGGE